MHPENPLAPPKPFAGLPLPTGDWHAPRRLYARGFPAGLTTALQVFPVLRTRLRDLVRSLGAGCVLEVGPGDKPIVDPGPGVCYLDVSHAILRGLAGARVEADLCQAPFPDDLFDLVVCADVFTHIPPERWEPALTELVRLAPKLLLFNPEPGAQKYASAPVESVELERMLHARGATTFRWPVDIGNDQGGRYRFGLILAER